MSQGVSGEGSIHIVVVINRSVLLALAIFFAVRWQQSKDDDEERVVGRSVFQHVSERVRALSQRIRDALEGDDAGQGEEVAGWAVCTHRNGWPSQ